MNNYNPIKKIHLIITKDENLKKAGLSETMLFTDINTMKELQKFKCYARLFNYLSQNEEFIRERSGAPMTDIDCVIDISEYYELFMKNRKRFFTTNVEYIKDTPELDEYGVLEKTNLKKVHILYRDEEDYVPSIMNCNETIVFASDQFIKEMKKYRCEMRFRKFLDDNKNICIQNFSVPKDNSDVTIDLTQAHKIYLKTRKDGLTDAYTYIKETPQFDKYGELI